jgi:hypothetical protein
MIGMRSPKTLRKHFRHELDTGHAEANAQVAQTLYRMAVSGVHPAATMFWLKTQARWREKPHDPAPPAAVPALIITQETAREPR